MAPFIVDFFRRLEEGNSKTREILATKSREILILIDIPLAEGTLTESVDARCALGAVSCPTGAVCLCAYISKPVVTAPPRHFYRRGDSRGKFIKPPPPLPSVGTQAARAFTGIKGRGRGKVIPFAFSDQNCPNVYFTACNTSPPLLFSRTVDR